MKQQWNSMKQCSETPWTKNQYKKIDISVVNVPDSRCFIGMKQRVSRPWNTLFQPDSRCFMTMKQCFILIQGVLWPCFILIQHVSRCFTTMKQIVSLLIHPDSACFTTMKQIASLLIHPDSTCFITISSLWFILFHAVSSLFHHCFTSGNEPLCESKFQFKIGHHIYYTWVIIVVKIYRKYRDNGFRLYDKVAREQNKWVMCKCAHHVFMRTCMCTLSLMMYIRLNKTVFIVTVLTPDLNFVFLTNLTPI